MRQHVWWPIISKRLIQELSFLLKQMIETQFICIVNEHIAMIFSFNKNKQWKHVSVQISKNI